MELEGTDSQIALLRDLPDGGLALLGGYVDPLAHQRRLLQSGWWLEQPPAKGVTTLPTTFSQSLYDMCSCINVRHGWGCATGAAAGALCCRRRGAAFIR